MALNCRMIFAAILATFLLPLASCFHPRFPVDQLGPGPTGFMIKTLDRGTRHRQYALFVPKNFSAAKMTRYPVIIHLHSMAESGSDTREVLYVGLAPFAGDRAAEFPFIVIFPQSDDSHWNPDSENTADVLAELDAVAAMYPIDKDRVTLMGFGTGGQGTWAIGAKYADRFAALVPMASTGSNLADADKLLHVAVRAYHNEGDPFAYLANDEAMVQKISSLGGTAQFFKTNDMGHDCWDSVYAEGELFNWLLKQRLTHAGQ